MTSACAQSSSTASAHDIKMWHYIDKPAIKDKECRSEIARAKHDLQRGEIAFCSSFGFLTFALRYEPELRELCSSYGLTFKYESFSDVIVPGQTQGCYGALMDRTISEKFGPTFKKRLEASADSLFIIRSLASTVDYIHCDTKPHLPGKPEGPDPEIYIAVPSNLLPQPRPQSDDYGPFMDISFVIEKSGQGHEFASASLIDADYKSGDITQFQDRLWQIAQVELAKVPLWVPGTLGGHPVRTRANVRVHFEALKTR